jgi:DNA polymerase-3 subunit alpha
MAVLTLDDKTARTEVTVYRELYEQHLNELVEDQIVIVEGKCDVDDFTEEHGVEAAKIMTVERARNSFARMLVLNVSETELGNGFIGTLRKLIDSSEGGCPVAIQYERPGCGARLMLGERWRVNATDSLIDGLKDQLGEQRVTVEY